MKKNKRILFFIVIISALFSFNWVIFITEVAAQDVIDAPSILKITSQPSYPVGKRVTVNIELVNEQDEGLPNKPFIVYIDGERVRRARTDDDGLAEITFSPDLPVGEYIVEAHFIGTEAYHESTGTTSIIIRPIELTIETLPPLSGISFDINGDIYETAENGQATMTLDSPGTYPLKILLPEPEPDEAETDTIIHFERWSDAVFMPERVVEVKDDRHIQAGLALFHRVGLQFFDLNNVEIETDRIDSTTLKSSYGSTHTFEDSGVSHWLQANRIARRVSGLEVTPVQYSVESVIIDGANVVNRYQQRFILEPEDTWTVELLLYFARVTGKDAIFGFPTGEGIIIEYPNDDVVALDFDENNEIFIGPLARGSYILQLTGVGGVAPPTPVALSRDQDVTLKVLSSFDIGVGLALGMLVGFGLLFYGRPELLRIPKNIFVAVTRLASRKFSHDNKL